MGPFARLAGTSARLALGPLVFLGVVPEALPKDRTGALVSKHSANVPAIRSQVGSVRTEAGFPPTVAGSQLPGLGRMGVQPEAIGGSTDGSHCLTAI